MRLLINLYGMRHQVEGFLIIILAGIISRLIAAEAVVACDWDISSNVLTCSDQYGHMHVCFYAQSILDAYFIVNFIHVSFHA